MPGAPPQTHEPSTRTWLDLFHRRTSGGRVIHEIDGLRALAVLGVLLFHASAWYSDPNGAGGTAGPGTLDHALAETLRTGSAGVLLFFCLSGFILGTPYAARARDRKPQTPLRKFYLRRLGRLLPLYLVTLAVFVAMAGAETFVRDHPHPATVSEVLEHGLFTALLIHNPVYDYPSPVMYIAWTLEIEFQFYILLPLIAQLYRVRAAWLRRGVLVGVSLFTSWNYGAVHPTEGLMLWNHAHYFLLGMLIADIRVHRACLPPPSKVWDLVAMLGLVGIVLTAERKGVNIVAVPWFIVLLIEGTLRGDLTKRLFSWGPAVALGAMSYTVYLWHNTVVAACRFPLRTLLDQDPSLQGRLIFMAIASVAAIALSVIPFLLIERPTMDPNWRQRLRTWFQNTRRR